MKTLEQLQSPPSLRLAMGELNAEELRVAQAAVRFAFFHLTDRTSLVPPRKTSERSSDGLCVNEQYDKGWNDCRDEMLKIGLANSICL